MIRTEGRREGDSIVGANERRRAILEVLCQRKQDTMKNLANEFHVSLRTICYDIDELTRNYPIVTIRGKYKIPVKSQNPGFAQKEIPPYNQSTQAGSKP